MPKTIKERLKRAASGAELREWARGVTGRWLALRPKSSPEHVSLKGFTPEELVRIAMIVAEVDSVGEGELQEEYLQFITRLSD